MLYTWLLLHASWVAKHTYSFLHRKSNADQLIKFYQSSISLTVVFFFICQVSQGSLLIFFISSLQPLSIQLCSLLWLPLAHAGFIIKPTCLLRSPCFISIVLNKLVPIPVLPYSVFSLIWLFLQFSKWNQHAQAILTGRLCWSPVTLSYLLTHQRVILWATLLE